MRFKPRFSTILEAVGNRKYTAKTAKEPFIDPQSMRKPSATFRKTTLALRRDENINCRTAENRGLDSILGRVA